jgi:hypothetical protein
MLCLTTLIVIYLCGAILTLPLKGPSDTLGFHLFLPVVTVWHLSEKLDHSKFRLQGSQFRADKFMTSPPDRAMCDLSALPVWGFFSHRKQLRVNIKQ